MFGVAVALRVITQIAYRPALLFIDSYRYLDLLDTLDPTKSQTLGYDLLVLWPLLKVGNLFLVVLVQHALGLAMGVGIYVLCLRYGVSRWLAAAAAAPILLDAYQLQIEQNIMSETIFEALLVGAMLALLWHRRPTTRALGDRWGAARARGPGPDRCAAVGRTRDGLRVRLGAGWCAPAVARRDRRGRVLGADRRLHDVLPVAGRNVRLDHDGRARDVRPGRADRRLRHVVAHAGRAATVPVGTARSSAAA